MRPSGGEIIGKGGAARGSAALAAALLLLPLPAASQQDFPPGSLSLMEAVRLALQKDPNIDLARTQVRMKEGALLQSQGQFDFKLAGTQSYNKTNTAQVGPVSYQEAVSQTSLYLSKKFMAGFTLKPEVDLSQSKYPSTDAKGNPYSVTQDIASVTVFLNVPLLRNAGGRAASAPERSARLDLEAERLNLLHTTSQRLEGIAWQYWTTAAAKEMRDRQAAAEANALKALQGREILVKAGEAAAAEVEQLRADYEDRTAKRIQAQADLVKAWTDLGSAIGLGASEMAQLPLPGDPFPSPDTASLPEDAHLARYLEEAQAHRVDLQARRLDVQSAQELRDLAKNQLRTRLDLDLGAGYSGQGEGLGIPDYFAPLRNRIPGTNISATLTLEWPIENRAALGEFAAKDAAFQRASVMERDARVAIGTAVPAALSGLRLAALRCDHAHAAAASWRKVVRNEEKKLTLGVSSVIDVLQFKESLNAAEMTDVQAMLELAKALVALRFETGTLLPPGGDGALLTPENFVTIPFPKEAAP